MEKLYNHINKYVGVDIDEFEKIASFFEPRSVNKKEMLYRAGSKILPHYFVLEGCIHMYFINDRGLEHTIQFAIADWWLTDYLAFQHNRSSGFNIEAVEQSELLQISYQKQQELLKTFPKMETYFRNIYQTAYGAALMRMKYIFSYSKEEIYYDFRDSFPEFVNNVPQYMVAAYLGLSPEYVSKLRRKSTS